MWAVNITKELPERREENERAKHGETSPRGVWLECQAEHRRPRNGGWKRP